MDVLVPLFNFNWDGDLFEIKKVGKIYRLPNMPDLSNFKAQLTEFDKDALRNVTHWLSFEHEKADTLSESERINIFMLSLWVALPTRTQVQISFKSSDNTYTVVRYLDRFQWNRLYSIDNIDNKSLNKVNEYNERITNIYINRNRLYNSLAFNLCANFSISWQVAFICFSGAMEAILTYSDRPGITKRLAKSFACLTEIDKSKRDLKFQRFIELYKIRSDIMHGRAMNYYDANINLKNLNQFEMLLREIWGIVLTSKDLIVELEKNDADRNLFFKKIESGYQPPSI